MDGWSKSNTQYEFALLDMTPLMECHPSHGPFFDSTLESIKFQGGSNVWDDSLLDQMMIGDDQPKP